MKKNNRVILLLLLLLLLFLTFALLTGCSNGPTSKVTPPENTGNSKSQNNSSKETVVTAKIGDYYPFKEGIKYTYAGEGNEYATYSVFVDYLRGNRQQIRVNNGGTETVQVLENSDGELRRIYSNGEIYYREDVTSKSNKNDVLLKEPLTKGNSWTLSDGSKRSITNLKVTIKTPLASYECLEVTTVRKENTNKNKEYYAPNIGLVKTIFTGEKDYEVSSSLSKMENNVPFVQSVKFYHPNGNDSFNYISEKTLSFNTNDITKKEFENYFKEAPNKNEGKLISANTKIKSLYLNKDNMVYVDFSKEFTQEMNAGSGYESQILQCITNTLGDYYMVKKVYITVEGDPYSSGHILMKKGEAFVVDHKNTKEL
jgi:spore germination protein GerM